MYHRKHVCCVDGCLFICSFASRRRWNAAPAGGLRSRGRRHPGRRTASWRSSCDAGATRRETPALEVKKGSADGSHWLDSHTHTHTHITRSDRGSHGFICFSVIDRPRLAEWTCWNASVYCWQEVRTLISFQIKIDKAKMIYNSWSLWRRQEVQRRIIFFLSRVGGCGTHEATTWTPFDPWWCVTWFCWT